MDRSSTVVRLRGRSEPWPALRLLAETAVAVQHTLGTGGEVDDRMLDELERALWLELAVARPDRREREYLIEQARGTVAPAGVPSCRHAARLLVRAGGLLLCAAERASMPERERMEQCASRCGEGAVRLERIALEHEGL